MTTADSQQDVPEYDDTQTSTASGSGTPEPAANRAAGEPTIDERDTATRPASGTLGSGDPQSPSASRILREAAIGGSGIHGTGAAVTVEGQDPEPPQPVEGTGTPDAGVTDMTATVPVDPGRKTGASNATEVVGAVRPHAPDGEVGPT